MIKKHPSTAVDAFDFGVLIYEVCNGDYSGQSQAGQTKNIPPTMHASYKRLCNANPKSRISVGVFLDQGSRHNSFFDTPLIKLTEGIDNLGMKSPGERDQFLEYVHPVRIGGCLLLTISLVILTNSQMISRKSSSR